MADCKPPSWNDIERVIARVDEVCRESERLRHRADRSMKQLAVWPDPRATAGPFDEAADLPDMDNEST